MSWTDDKEAEHQRIRAESAEAEVERLRAENEVLAQSIQLNAERVIAELRRFANELEEDLRAALEEK